MKLLLIVCCFAMAACGQEPLRLNQIQVIGSHNSYHAGLAPSQFALLMKTNPDAAKSLEYSHPPLDVQLSNGVRQIELDVWVDSKGGLFAHPQGPDLVAKAGLPADPPFDTEGVMTKPGFKVMHVQDIDFRSTCEPFINCLQVVRKWSQAHPNHLPIFILIENEDGNPRPGMMTEPEKLTPAAFDALDAEIRSVFAPSEIITPDDVRASHATLNEAVTKDGWPTLDASRGKVTFLMDQGRFGAMYLEGHPSLKGRVLFTNAQAGAPDAAFVEVNEPLPDTTVIPKLVKQGYLVRTRTDEPTGQARTGDTKQREAALASGAQMLSTDYPFQEVSKWTSYSVSFPGGGIARCNPVTTARQCTLQ